MSKKIVIAFVILIALSTAYISLFLAYLALDTWAKSILYGIAGVEVYLAIYWAKRWNR